MPTKKTSPTFERGVIYARYSSSGQREESIEGQLRDCHAYAERLNIKIVGEYCDYALTGTTDKRPEFQKMIKDSARGQFTVVIVWKLDRFARNRYDSATYKARLKQNGVKVISAKEAIPDGAEGILFESLMEGYAEYYSRNLSENVKRGMYDSALKRYTLGQYVYGLRPSKDKTWEHDPASAPIVKRIFEEYADGRSAKEIYTDLNNEGYRTRRNNPFNKNSLRKILTNERYIGVYRYADIYDENGISPIVSKELFNEVQKMIKKHSEAPAAKKTDGGFLLTSKLFCGHCGELMTGDCGTGKSGHTYSYYSCKNKKLKKCDKKSVRKEWIEDIVVQKLADLANDDEMIELFADKFMAWQERQKPSDALTDLETKWKQADTAINNTLAFIDSGVATDSLRKHLIDLEEQKEKIETGISKVKAEKPTYERETIVFFLRRFRDADTSDISWRIYLVETFLHAAYLYDDGRLRLQLNISGDERDITLQILDKAVDEGESLCSDFAQASPPQRAKPNTYIAVYFYEGLLIAETVLR